MLVLFVLFCVAQDYVPCQYFAVNLLLPEQDLIFPLIYLFRCEVMTSCGWGKRVPAETHGLELVRSKVLQYFIDLRRIGGIRAHIWP